jgi:hypothetical protein
MPIEGSNERKCVSSIMLLALVLVVDDVKGLMYIYIYIHMNTCIYITSGRRGRRPNVCTYIHVYIYRLH